MGNQHGDFIWYELLTSDADAAGAFYGKVVGWTSVQSGQPGMDYRFFVAGDANDNRNGVGGFMAITPDMAAGGARPAWVGYICVDDVDASVAALLGAGGSVLMPAMTLDGVGRMAMVADPQGVPFYVMKGASDEASHSFAATEPKVGHCAWNELATSDPQAALAFYTAAFGWRQGDSMDMGAMGTYQFLDHGPSMIGAIMPKMPSMPAAWTYYFRVADIDAAIAAIHANGGRLLMEPMEIPGGEFAFQAMDPQGAAFALMGPRH